MVMIVKDHEKKTWGFISVTWITARAHVSALPGRTAAWRSYTPAIPRQAMAAPAHAVAPFRLPRCREGVGSAPAGAYDA